jgi:hypothetical protein
MFANTANKLTFFFMNIYESLKYNGKSNIFKGMHIHEFLSIL